MVVVLGHRFNHLFAVFFGLRCEIGGDIDQVVFGAQRLIAPGHGLHLDQIDHAFELVFGTHRKLDYHRLALQPGNDGFD
jgi:hypothetical protein